MMVPSMVCFKLCVAVIISIWFVFGLTDGKEVVGKLTNDYNIDTKKVTLSGLSGGGSFAEILHLTYSSHFSGIGIFSAFFYRCGNYSKTIEEHYAKCGNPGGYPTKGFKPNTKLSNPNLAVKNAKEYADAKLIDPLNNLRHQKVFIWQGTIDVYTTPNNGLSVLNIYEPYLDSKEQVYTKIQYANHHLPTINRGTNCPMQSDPTKDAFIGKCQYNGVYNMLDFLLPQNTVVSPENQKSKLTNLKEFDQSEFFHGIGNSTTIGLADVGFIYVPSNCTSTKNKCYLHFYFHGCFLTFSEVGTKHIVQSGFLEVAEANNIIVVFPMAKVTPANTGGCFDFFGYTGSNYAMKTGKQITIIQRILERLGA